jgi:hypothetical protein
MFYEGGAISDTVGLRSAQCLIALANRHPGGAVMSHSEISNRSASTWSSASLETFFEERHI